MVDAPGQWEIFVLSKCEFIDVKSAITASISTIRFNNVVNARMANKQRV